MYIKYIKIKEPDEN